MRLTLAMGLQYDSAGRGSSAKELVLAQSPPLKVSESVIDVESLPRQTDVAFEFSSLHGFHFLTYNLSGVPVALEVAGDSIDLFM